MIEFVPKNFVPPKKLETERFRLRMLTINDLEKDYDAVMTSINHLQKTIPFGPDHKWPTEELTMEQDLIDLGWHQKEFQRKTSFAYTMMNLDESKCLGCLYIYPSENPKYDAMIMMWVREDEANTGLDDHLFINVKSWIKNEFPFNNVAYPGREIAWSEFKK